MNKALLVVIAAVVLLAGSAIFVANTVSDEHSLYFSTVGEYQFDLSASSYLNYLDAAQSPCGPRCWALAAFTDAPEHRPEVEKKYALWKIAHPPPAPVDADAVKKKMIADYVANATRHGIDPAVSERIRTMIEAHGFVPELLEFKSDLRDVRSTDNDFKEPERCLFRTSNTEEPVKFEHVQLEGSGVAGTLTLHQTDKKQTITITGDTGPSTLEVDALELTVHLEVLEPGQPPIVLESVFPFELDAQVRLPADHAVNEVTVHALQTKAAARKSCSGVLQLLGAY